MAAVLIKVGFFYISNLARNSADYRIRPLFSNSFFFHFEYYAMS